MANVKNKSVKDVVVNGKKLQKLRQQNGWSIEELHVVSGVNQSTIRAIEGNKNAFPTVPILYKLTKAVGITVEDVIEEVE